MSKHTDNNSARLRMPQTVLFKRDGRTYELRPGDSSRDESRTTRTETGQSRSTPDSKCDRVETFLHGLKMILSHHRAPSKVIRSFYKQAHLYLNVPSEELFLKRAKYLLLAPMSQYLGNEEPKQPDLVFVPKGAWRRWSRERLRSFRGKNTHLWYSFLQGKRGAAPVSKEIVLSNFQTHREQMLAPDPIGVTEEDEDFLDSIMEAIGPVLRRVAKTLKKTSTILFRRPWEHTFSASQSAALESSRKTGGQKGHLRRILGREGVLSSGGELVSMTDHTGLRIRNNALVANPVSCVRQETAPEDIFRDLIEKYNQTVPMPPLEARVEAVIEPFKVRTISKGPAAEYFLAKPMQKAIHTAMRKMAPFRLIGRPFSPLDLMDIREAQEAMGSLDDHYWLSVDYSAATDGLSATLSKSLLESILGPLAFENLGYFRLLMNVLAPHLISYPKVAGVKLDDVQQLNGQLMGSPLSFPILCLANLALYLLVRKQTRPSAKMKDLLNAVLVNGDDMIYIGTKEEWRLHQELGSKLGLAMSPGKAYFHRKYANINSVNTTYDLGTRSTPVIQPFLNVGLMVGNHKVMGKVGSDDDEKAKTPYSSVINEVVRGALPGRQSEVLKQYIMMHRSDLRRETKGRNLFIPVSAGGMGQTAPADFKVYVTKKQREIAGGILKRSPWLMPAERPMEEGKELLEVDDKLIDPLEEMEVEDQVWRPRKGPQTDESLFFGFVPYSRS